MDLRTLLYFPSIYKGLEQYVTHDLVVQKVADTVRWHSAATAKTTTATSPTLKILQFLISKIVRRIIFMPSPMRLLRLLVATKCEFCLKQNTWTRYESTFGLSDCADCRESAVTTIIQKNRCCSNVRHESAVSFETMLERKAIKKVQPSTPPCARRKEQDTGLRRRCPKFSKKYVIFIYFHR